MIVKLFNLIILILEIYFWVFINKNNDIFSCCYMFGIKILLIRSGLLIFKIDYMFNFVGIRK